MSEAEGERLRRWRMVLGGGASDGTGAPLSAEDAARDRALEALYDSDRSAGLGGSSPNVARWLGDIRAYFPRSVVRVMQRDAFDRLNLRRLLLEPEMLEAVQPDVHLVADLIALGRVIPTRTRATARAVVKRVVDELMARLAQPTRQAVRGALTRALKSRRPRPGDIDWVRTIRANLRHYQPKHRTIVPERLVGFGRRRSQLHHIILCVDQSGSMAPSVVYSSVFAAVLASVPAVRTSLVVFDTSVVDLTGQLSDPVDVLFGTQLGGGTDIDQAIAYVEGLVDTAPTDTIVVLISDLFEGGDEGSLLARVRRLVDAGVRVVTLLALADDGAPAYDHQLAASLAALGVPSFACTPDRFPELMAAAIGRRDIARWAAENDLVCARG